MQRARDNDPMDAGKLVAGEVVISDPALGMEIFAVRSGVFRAFPCYEKSGLGSPVKKILWRMALIERHFTLMEVRAAKVSPEQAVKPSVIMALPPGFTHGNEIARRRKNMITSRRSAVSGTRPGRGSITNLAEDTKMNRAKISAERWREIKPLLESALELKEDDRRAFLDEVCAGDQSLRRDMDSFIAAHEQAGDFLDKPAFEEAARMLASEGVVRKTLIPDGVSTKERSHKNTTLVEDRQNFTIAPGWILDGRYMIERELGQGGIGQVFLARNLKLPGGPHVVIKVLREQTLEREDRDWFEKKFRAEIEALSRINHPGVVNAFDAGHLPDGRAYFVMQYVPGRTLRSVMPPHGMNPKRAADLLRKIAQALDSAHEHGVIHRDLKPANIMLQTAGREEYIKIIDFGIATVLETTGAHMSKQTRAIGTLPYMAPEQLQGRPTAASDIFALGVLAFEMVTGQLPFNGDSTAQQIEMQRAGVEEKLCELRAGLPEAARVAILKAIAFEASTRYRAALEFSEAFDRALVEPDQPDPFQTTPISPALRLPAAPRQPAAPRRRWLPLTAVLIVALLAAAAVGTIAWLRLAPAKEGMGANPGPSPPALAERTLSYLLEAQKNTERYPGSEPFTPPVDIIFKAGDQVRLKVSSPQDCYLYVINEGPERANGLPDLVVMFPNDGGSAQVAANQSIQIPMPSRNPETDWFEFNEEVGVEKIWLIWSERSVAEMEAIKGLANPKDQGLVSDPSQISAVARYLEALMETKVEVEKDEASRRTKLKGKGEVLASVVRLQHR
jgi:serine/threonine protein kinase